MVKPTQEQVIAWAREAGIKINPESAYAMEMHRFAILAYEAGQESMKWDGIHSCHPDCQRPACVHTRKTYQEGYEAGRKNENEACAVEVAAIDADGWEFNMAAIIRARREQ